MTVSLIAVLGVPLLPLAGVLLCVVMAIAAFFAPRGSKRLQRRLTRFTRSAANKSASKAPGKKTAKAASKPLDETTKAINRSAKAGRAARRWFPL